MIARWGQLWALLSIVLHIHAVLAGPFQVLGREDISPTVTPTPTTSIENVGGTGEASSGETDATRSTQKPTIDKTSIIIATSTTAFPSAVNGNNPDNIGSLATPSPIPAGELPLHPRLTPGWGIAGAILLISGAVYTLIGIKNTWLHTFFSAAFLSGLSVTVLIVYVMVPPVPVAIEGAYVVAAVVSGGILGGIATVFRELTEGLGCLLGGFCISMWLLTLKPGGLLPSMPGKVIFISALSVGSYAFYFSRYTRPYALLGLISFAGATVTVLGIDCFSKAGLKEFWAYIWDLNNGLFPYAADTYPLTKGIRVEIAITVVFTIAGIISQLKLWRVIQERRAKKAKEQAEEQRKRDEEEANIGLRVETQNERERREWETVYGNQPPRSSAGSGDSGVEDVEDEKKDGAKEVVVRQVSSNGDNIELPEMPTPNLLDSPDTAKKPADGLMMTNNNDDSRVTIRVAGDDEPNGNDDLPSMAGLNEKAWTANGDTGAQSTSTDISQISPKPPGPEITPLPFKVPEFSEEYNGSDGRSSIATYADEDDGDYVLSGKPLRMSLTNRFSSNPGNFLHDLSHRSTDAQTPKQSTREFGLPQYPDWEASTEELVENFKRHSDVLSIAATVDGLSQDGDAFEYSTKDEAKRTSIPAVRVDLGGDSTDIDSHTEKERDSDMKLKPPNSRWSLNARPTSSAETVGTDILNPSVVNSSSGEIPKRNSLNQSTRRTESTTQNNNQADMNGIEESSESSPPAKSLAPSTTSTAVSLTKDRLPSALPRVALSFRTNEWAKHLGEAELPPVEQLRIEEYAEGQHDRKQDIEATAPVHFEALQQTPESDSREAVIVQTTSSGSNLPSRAYHSASRIQSSPSQPKAHIPATLAILTSASLEADPQGSPTKPAPSNLPQAGHSFRNKGQRKSSEVYNQPIQEESGSEELPSEQLAPSDGDGSSTPNSTPPSPNDPAPIPGVVSYSSPQTLLGRREMYLRNKTQSQLFTIAPIQETPNQTMRPASQMASPYNYAGAPTPPLTARDADDIPLSQRKHLIQQNSAPSLNPTGARPQRGSSWNAAQPPVSNPPTQIHTITAESSRFDSHQPQRRVSRPSQAERDARLSQFRQSVAADLRAAAPAAQKSTTPLLRTTSSTSLAGPSPSNADIGRALDIQRSAMMSQREQEAQKREMERWEKERQERAFEEMMRRGDLIDAHREALRRMQGGVKHE